MPHILLDLRPHPPGLDAVKAHAAVTIDICENPEQKARAFPEDRLRDVEILFGTHAPLNLDAMPNLRWIQLASVGFTQLLGLHLGQRGIAVTNARGCLDVPIAEWNIAMMVNLARDLRGMIRNQEAAIWDNSARFQREIRGMRVGIWGYGGIGRETARLANVLGLEIHVMTRRGIQPRIDTYAVAGTGDDNGTLPHRVYQAGEELDFLRSLDFLIVAMPLSQATEGIIGERELRALSPTAYVLNPARGPIIQQQALLRALDEGWIAGAALDTHYAYPLPPAHPLWRYPNVILTPHISGSMLSQHFQDRIWDVFSSNLRRFTQGVTLLNRVDPAELT